MHRNLVLLLGLALLGLGRAASAADAPMDPRMVEHAIGDANAPVRVDEYYSLDCPHCARFEEEVLPQIKQNYVDNGKVRIVFHDFPLHQISLEATMVARCAPPDRFFAIIDTLFRVQSGWVLQSPQASTDALKQQAKFAGMTDAQIDSCLNDRMLEDEILAERLDAEKKLQINATPTFVFNQRPDDRIVAEGPYEKFQEKIDSLLKK